MLQVDVGCCQGLYIVNGGASKRATERWVLAGVKVRLSCVGASPTIRCHPLYRNPLGGDRQSTAGN